MSYKFKSSDNKTIDIKITVINKSELLKYLVEYNTFI